VLQSLRLTGREFGGCAWEGSGLRVAFAMDSFIYFANIRANYKVLVKEGDQQLMLF